MLGNLEDLTRYLLKWNRDSFGNLYKQKRTILAHINGIQKSPNYIANKSLQKMENKLIVDFNEILKLEEIHWHQKSKVQWLQQGERNTKFFHATTISKRIRS